MSHRISTIQRLLIHRSFSSPGRNLIPNFAKPPAPWTFHQPLLVTNQHHYKQNFGFSTSSQFRLASSSSDGNDDDSKKSAKKDEEQDSDFEEGETDDVPHRPNMDLDLGKISDFLTASYA